MEKIKLNAKIREEKGKKVKKIRREGLIPAVLYGKGKESQNLSLDLHDFEQMYKEAGTSSIVLLSVDGKEKNVLVHEVDLDPLTSKPNHADFYEVSMTEKITTTVPLVFTGDSIAVIEMDGTLTTNKSEIEIECLPVNLPHEIEVDISPLSDFEASIHVSDLKIPEGVEVKDDPEEVVASVEPPRSEEELAELEEAPEEVEMPESEHGEAEGEEGAEGEEAPEGGSAEEGKETEAGEEKSE